MTYKVTLKGNRKMWLKKVTLKSNQNFRATERKREKFTGNASAKKWKREKKVEKIILKWGKEKRKNELSIYRERNTIQVFILNDVGFEAFFPFFFFQTFICSNNDQGQKMITPLILSSHTFCGS